METSFELQTSGSLNLKSTQPTLVDVEAFCAEARRLGLSDNARMYITRQGVLGPIVGLHFDIPVAPKERHNG